MEALTVLSMPWTTYLWVFGFATLGGMVGYLNKPGPPTWGQAGIIALTSWFNGFMIFCVCTAWKAEPEFTMFACGIVGMMGRRAWLDFEGVLRMYLRQAGNTQPLDPYGPPGTHYGHPTEPYQPEDYPSESQEGQGSWGGSSPASGYDEPYDPRRPRNDDEANHD